MSMAGDVVEVLPESPEARGVAVLTDGEKEPGAGVRNREPAGARA
jgi:hypothetical protein